MEKDVSGCAITSVGCCVSTCGYNTPDKHCSAQRIDVANENAERKAETFCSTFKPKDCETSC